MEEHNRLRRNLYDVGKKGQIQDMMFVLVVITSLAITMLIAGFLYREIKPAITENGLATTNSTLVYNQFEIAFPMFDWSMFFIVIALIMGLIVSSLFIPSSPVFLVINIVGLLALIYLGAVFSNLYGEMLDQDGGNTTMAEVAEDYYPVITMVMKNLPYIGVILVLFASVAMYAKSRNDYG